MPTGFKGKYAGCYFPGGNRRSEQRSIRRLIAPQLLNGSVDMGSSYMRADRIESSELLFKRGKHVKRSGHARGGRVEVFQCQIPR